MAITLTKRGEISARAASEVWSGNTENTLPADKALTIETSPGGEELLVLAAVDHDRTIQIHVNVLDPV